MLKIAERADDANALKRFGLALVRDDRFVVDDTAAARLVDKLIRQCGVAPVGNGARREGRTALYGRLIELYRRHVRHMTVEEDMAPADAAARGAGVVCGLRALPPDLREALLLVGLARFTHAEAAQALDIPLSRLIERLERARCRLAAHMGVDLALPGWSGAPHLRVIK